MCNSILGPRGVGGILLAWAITMAPMAPSPTAEAAAVSWIDDDGSWDDGTKWSTGAKPGPDDDVTIDRPLPPPPHPPLFTVTHRQDDDTIKSLTNKEEVIVSGGALSFKTSLDNAGTIALSGSDLYSAAGGSGPVVATNQAAGLFDLQSNVGLSTRDETSATFNNLGTFTKSAGAGISTVAGDWTFSNTSTGTVQVQSGTLSFVGACNNAGAAQVQTGAVLDLAGGGTSTGTPGRTTYAVSSGAMLNFSGGTHNFNRATFSNEGTINFSAGTANFTSTPLPPPEPPIYTVSLPGTVNFSGATITGTDTVEASPAATFNWTNGNMTGSGTTKISAAARLNANSGSSPTQFLYLARTLDNRGTVVLSGSRAIYARDGGSTPTIINEPTATFDVQSDAGLTSNYETDGTFTNKGMFVKSAGTGTSFADFYWTFDNPGDNTGTNGEVKVQCGELKLAQVVQLPSTTLTGGTWIIIGPNPPLTSTLTIASGGPINTNKGTVVLDGPGSIFRTLQPDVKTIDQALTNNEGTLKILNGRDFTKGDLSNSDTLEVGLGSTLTISGNLTIPITGILKIDGRANIYGLNVGLGGSGGLLQKTGTGTMIISGPQQYGAGAILQFGAGSGPSPEGPSSQAAISTVPEPGTLSLLILAGLCLLIYARRWKS